MNITTGKVLHINERDNSPSKYCVTGDYKQIDTKAITFDEWKEKCLAFDPEVDFTYWEFDIKFSWGLKREFKKENENFTQERYIITNRRMVHVFNNDKYYHASGFHTAPKTTLDMLKSLYNPDIVRFRTGAGPDTYEMKNLGNKTKSFLNVQDSKYLKIQTSYLNESILVIEDLDLIYTNNVEKFSNIKLNEAVETTLMNEDYELVSKLLYTYNPNEISLFGTENNGRDIAYMTLAEGHVEHLFNNLSFLEEMGLDYMIEGYNLKLIKKEE